MSKRDEEALRQTNPELRGKRGGVPRPQKAFADQMQPVLEALEKDGELTEPVRQMLTAGPGDQIHHIDGLDVLDALFQNTNNNQAAELRGMTAAGNDIRNLMVMPQRSHQGIVDEYAIQAVHQILRDKGLEMGAAGAKLHPLLKEISAASDAPFDLKKDLLRRYITEIQPQMVEAVDTALTDYEKRFAGDVMDKYINEIRRGKHRYL